jgi:hypothetical protein
MKRTGLILLLAVGALATACTAPAGPDAANYPSPGCYDSSIPGEPDVAYNGFINRLDNAILAGSEDGTCAVSGSTPWMLATSDTETSAGVECNDENPAWTSAEQMLGLGYTIVEYAHLCAP